MINDVERAKYDRLKEERDRRYGELLAAARASGPVVQLVVELHVPDEIPTRFPGHPQCQGCFGTVQGESAWWPEDCDTTQVVARALGVDLT